MPKNEHIELYTIIKKAKEVWGDEVIKNLELYRELSNIFTYKICLSNNVELNILWLHDYENNKPPTSIVSSSTHTETYVHDDIYDRYAALKLLSKHAHILGVGINVIKSDHEYNSLVKVTCDSRYSSKLEARLLTVRKSFIRSEMLDKDADFHRTDFEIKFNQDVETITNEELTPILNLLQEGLKDFGYIHDSADQILSPYTPTGYKYTSVYHTQNNDDPNNDDPNTMYITCVSTQDV